MTLMSLFKRQPKPPTPTVVETAPLPPSSSRREKEAQWLRATGSSASLRSTGRSRRSFWPTATTRAPVEPRPTFQAPGGGVELTPRRAAAPVAGAIPSSSSSSSSSPALSLPASPRSNAHLPASPAARSARPPALATIPSSSRPNATTTSLATRLQELATSNADGLLDDNEYRMLRGQLFEKYAVGSRDEALALGQGAESVPRLGQDGHARRSGSSSAPTTPRTRRAPSPPPPLPAASRALSFRSSASRTRSGVGSLFRKSSAANVDADWDVVKSPRLDVDSIINGGSDRRSRVDALLVEELQPIRPRSVSRHPGVSSAALQAYGGGGSSKGGGGGSGDSFFSSEGSVHRNSAYAPSSRRGTTLPSSPCGRSHVESIVWAQPSLPPMATSTDPFLFATADANPTSKELKLEITQIEDEWGRVGEAWAALEDGAVQKWENHLGPSGLKGLETLIALRSKTLAPLAPKPEPPSSTKRLSRKPSFRSSSALPPPTTPRPPHLAPAFVTALDSPLAAGTPDEVEAATQTLRKELAEIAARRKATEDKYEKRLEFLRAKLRGALIREQLPR